ncbi:MAG: hypothetical protein II459_04865, partial [Erysipelotrichaceae bacterium]|nr:hypothetical protein [Erysipelotrichaceae bacterium]
QPTNANTINAASKTVNNFFISFSFSFYLKRLYASNQFEFQQQRKKHLFDKHIIQLKSSLFNEK